MYKQWFAIAGIFGVYGTLCYFWPWAFVWSLIPTYLMAMPFTTVYQHRFMTHGAMKMKKWLQQTFETVGYCCVGPNTREWVGAHTAHHKWSDSDKDPHTPRWVREQDGTYRVAQGMEGLFPAIMPLNVVAWGRWIKENQHLIPQFAPQVVRSETPWIKWMRRHKYLGLLTGTSVLALATWLVHGNPFIGLAAAIMHFIQFVFILNPLINGVCHIPHKWFGGYQHTRAEIALSTFNNWVIALLTGGEGLHHNHHWQQPSAKFAVTRRELPVDTGYLLICVLEWIGWVWDVKRPKFVPE